MVTLIGRTILSVLATLSSSYVTVEIGHQSDARRDDHADRAVHIGAVRRTASILAPTVLWQRLSGTRPPRRCTGRATPRWRHLAVDGRQEPSIHHTDCNCRV